MNYFIYHKTLFSARFGKMIGIEVRVSDGEVSMPGFSKLSMKGPAEEFSKISKLLDLDKDPELLTTVVPDRTIEDLIRKIKGIKAPVRRNPHWESTIGDYRV